MLMPGALAAQTAPTIDTEDAQLGEVTVGEGRFHPVLGADIRNGDFARGSYDDDAANLHRLPVHLQAGFNYAIGQGADGQANAWLVVTSSNGIHSPASYEVVHPRAWYESNNLVGVVAEPLPGLRVGGVYTIKTSPNDVSGTTHEASLTAAFEAKQGWGVLNPTFVATVHPQGGGGIYTQFGVSPSLPLGSGEKAPSLGVPLLIGVGWDGFYQRGTGSLTYGSAGLSLSQPFRMGPAHAEFQASALALIRDNRLRRLGSADAETSMVVPLVQIGVSVAL